MPDWCLSMRCIDCESHAIVGGKLDCNYMNRLGLSQPTVKTFIEDTESPEKLEARIRDAKERQMRLQEEMKELEKLKEEYGTEEKKDGSVSSV